MRKLFILLISLYGILPATGVAAYFDESALGRLFTTPQQRHQIDAFRKGKGVGVIARSNQSCRCKSPGHGDSKRWKKHGMGKWQKHNGRQQGWRCKRDA